jgi:hypothetical protein
MWDLSLPGYKYLGPGNKMNKGRPNNWNDFVSLVHDDKYKRLEKLGKVPHTLWTESDEAWLRDTNWQDYGGVLGKLFFNVKKGAYRLGLIKHAGDKDTDPPLQKQDFNDDFVNKLATDISPKDKKPQALRSVTGKRLFDDDADDANSFRDRPPTKQAKGLEGNKITTKLQDQTNQTQNAMPTGQQGDGSTGSGNNAGLRETPIDNVGHVERGPPEYTFASLPFTRDFKVVRTAWSTDEGFRLTSPYDPQMTLAAAIDNNVGIGSTTTQTVATPDTNDTSTTSARWFDYYASMYNYYHVVGSKWHLTFENLSSEPIWLHVLKCNDEIPPVLATNEDIMNWKDAESHFVGTHAVAITTTGRIETNHSNNSENNVEGASSAGLVPNFEANQHVQSRGNGPIVKLSGKYRPGQIKRQIHLDSEIENWTAVTANPLLPERLLFRVKPYWNAISLADGNSYDRALQFRFTFTIDYLVEFKELKVGLRWPIERQPLLAVVQTNPTEDEE